MSVLKQAGNVCIFRVQQAVSLYFVIRCIAYLLTKSTISLNLFSSLVHKLKKTAFLVSGRRKCLRLCYTLFTRVIPLLKPIRLMKVTSNPIYQFCLRKSPTKSFCRQNMLQFLGKFNFSKIVTSFALLR